MYGFNFKPVKPVLDKYHRKYIYFLRWLHIKCKISRSYAIREESCNFHNQIYLVTFVTFQNTAGIAENLLAEKVNIWPNPSSDFVNVSMPAQSSMKIVDMSGRVITSIPKTGEQERIDLNSFTKGIYFVQIGESGLSEKIIIQ